MGRAEDAVADARGGWCTGGMVEAVRGWNKGCSRGGHGPGLRHGAEEAGSFFSAKPPRSQGGGGSTSISAAGGAGRPREQGPRASFAHTCGCCGSLS